MLLAVPKQNAAEFGNDLDVMVDIKGYGVRVAWQSEPIEVGIVDDE